MDLDAFLDGSDDQQSDPLDTFLDQKEGTMSEARLRGERAADAVSDSFLGAPASFLSGAAQGATFGFDDEIIGALSSIPAIFSGDKSVYDSYIANRDEVRQYNDRMAEKRPGWNFAGDIVSSVAVPGGLAKKAMQGIGAARKSSNLAKLTPREKEFYDFVMTERKTRGIDPDDPEGWTPRSKWHEQFTNAMGVGAAAGGLRAAGENEDNSEIIGDVVQGGALGSLLGGAGNGLKVGGELTQDAISRFSPRSHKLTEALIESLEGVDGPVADTLRSMYYAQPDAVANMVGKLTKSGIDMPMMGVKAARMASDAAVPVGRAMMNPKVAAPFGSAMGALSAERMDSNDLFLDAEPERRGETKGPTLTDYLADPSQLIQRAHGTQYGNQLMDAAGDGPESFRATVFVLAQRPEFRRAMGLD